MNNKFWRAATSRICVVAIIASTAFVSRSECQDVISSYQPVVGEPHFDFAFPDIKDGTLKKLSDFRGKKVLLLHFASW